MEDSMVILLGQGGHPPSEGTGMARCRMEEAEWETEGMEFL